MPDSGAVYQPTTVGYSYDGVRNIPGVGIRTGFTRIMSRHKISTKKWFEWVLLSVAICSFVAGLTMMLANVVYVDIDNEDGQKDKTPEKTSETEVVEKSDVQHVKSIVAGACIMLFGSVLGIIWIWLKCFHRRKSPRGGLTNGSSGGQMLGGLNPSTDLLVGSSAQYGPVLTELPSQTKLKNSDMPTIPLSDQEEETHTLMQDSATQNTGPHTIIDRIPG